MKSLRCEVCSSSMVDGTCQNCGAKLEYSIKEHDNEGILFYNDEDFAEAGFDIFVPDEQYVPEFNDEPTDEELTQIEEELNE